ncbi:MAG: hypothetical protein C0423_01995 [Methylibium sp.]|nr:hypothetical protein [Methylibium sp.]
MRCDSPVGAAHKAATLLLLGLLAAGLPRTTLASRQIAGEDGADVQAGRCQLESWGDREGKERAWSVASACGMGPGIELGAELTRYQADASLWQHSGGLHLKLAPERWELSTLLGPLSFELKLSLGYERPAAAWRHNTTQLVGTASLALNERWSASTQLGAQRERRSAESPGRTSASGSLALSYLLNERSELYGELQSPIRRSGIAPAQRTLGAFVWLQPETVGLSLSAGRAHGLTLWSAGIGWYGLRL